MSRELHGKSPSANHVSIRIFPSKTANKLLAVFDERLQCNKVLLFRLFFKPKVTKSKCKEKVHHYNAPS